MSNISTQALMLGNVPAAGGGLAPVAWYAAENDTTDSQNSNDATAGAGTTYSSGGYSGYCFIFDGSNRSRIVTVPTLNLGKTWSVDAYINPTGGGSYNHIISKGWTQFDFGAWYYDNSAKKLKYWLNGSEVFSTPNNSITLSTWQRVTLTRDDADDKYRFYIDGVLSATSSASGLDYAFNNQCGIGSNLATPTDAPFYGKIDEIKFYDALILTP